MITAGSVDALETCIRTLASAGQAIGLENPGYQPLRHIAENQGMKIHWLALDGDGARLPAAADEPPALVVLTPSQQFPLGGAMPVARRREYLRWVREQGAWIVEDDYDSEFRYAGRPLAALQGLDADRAGETGAGGGRVIYLGTFSKILFPSLRLGYLVVPPDLVEPFARARAALDDHPSAVAQPALAEFFEAGHFAAHVRRMRLLYGARRECLLAAAERHLGGLLELAPDAAGLHLVARPTPELAARMDDTEAAARAAAAGLATPALSSYYMGNKPSGGGAPEQGLLLGYAAVTEPEIETGIEILARALC
jgi:GntR family transcriptional regulator/MocR family aminotransferase